MRMELFGASMLVPVAAKEPRTEEPHDFSRSWKDTKFSGMDVDASMGGNFEPQGDYKKSPTDGSGLVRESVDGYGAVDDWDVGSKGSASEDLEFLRSYTASGIKFEEDLEEDSVPPPPSSPPPACLEETPIKPNKLSFADMVESVPLTGSSGSNSSTSVKKPKPFLKRGSRNWNRVSSVEKQKTKPKPSRQKTVEPLVEVKVPRRHSTSEVVKDPPTTVRIAPYKPMSVDRTSKKAISSEDIKVAEGHASLPTKNTDRGDFAEFFEHGRGTDRYNDDQSGENDEQSGEEDTTSIQPPVSSLVKNMFHTLEPRVIPTKAEDQVTPMVPEEKSNENAIRYEQMSARLLTEMDKFKEGNEQLAKSLKKLESDRAQISKERSQLEKDRREFDKKVQGFEKSSNDRLRRDQQQIQKERNTLERQREHIELLRATAKVERKDRSQVEVLENKISNLELGEKERTIKHKEALFSKSQRISDLEKEVKKLEEALKFTEERRLDAWAKQSKSEKLLYEMQVKFQSLEADYETLKREKKQVREDLPPENENSRNEINVSNPKVKKKKDKRTKRNIVDRDGTRVITFEDGTVKEIEKGGETTTTFPNGDVKKYIPTEDLEIYFFAETDTTRTRYADGMVLVEFPNKQVERTCPDGTCEVFYPDGTVKTTKLDKTEVTLFPDGTKVISTKDGKRKVIKPCAGTDTP